MNDGVGPKETPLTEEELARVLAGHPHYSLRPPAAAGGGKGGDKATLLGKQTVRVGFADNAASKDPYVTELLNRMANLYSERNAVYKDNYLKVGAVMSAMFPHGKTLKTADDFNRWHLFELAIVKLTRYANQYEEGGHQDSIEDMIVYLAMVAGLDREFKLREPDDMSDMDK